MTIRAKLAELKTVLPGIYVIQYNGNMKERFDVDDMADLERAWESFCLHNRVSLYSVDSIEQVS